MKLKLRKKGKINKSKKNYFHFLFFLSPVSYIPFTKNKNKFIIKITSQIHRTDGDGNNQTAIFSHC